MGWLENLQNIVKIEVNSLKSLISISINKNSNNIIKLEKVGYFLDKKEKVLHISPDKYPEILKIAREYVEEGNKLLESESNNLLDEVYQYRRENKDQAVLAFFKPIISQIDYECLESALFIRAQFKMGKDIHKLKEGLRKRFGNRGNNISNLCTAEYFEGFLMPLYNESQKDFSSIYEEIVSKSIVAIFVHSEMKSEEIPALISNRIDISKKYGIKFIHIRGIGKGNVNKIKECISKNKEYFDFFDKKIYENQNGDIIIVELLFK